MHLPERQGFRSAGPVPANLPGERPPQPPRSDLVAGSKPELVSRFRTDTRDLSCRFRRGGKAVGASAPFHNPNARPPCALRSVLATETDAVPWIHCALLREQGGSAPVPVRLQARSLRQLVLPELHEIAPGRLRAPVARWRRACVPKL